MEEISMSEEKKQNLKEYKEKYCMAKKLREKFLDFFHSMV